MKGNFVGLTKRQRECLEAVCASGDWAAAARGLFVTENTLHDTLKRARRVLGMKSTVQICYALGQARGYEKVGA